MEQPIASKIRLKLGPIEIEYEGSESFLKKELPDLLSAVLTLYKESGAEIAALENNPLSDGTPAAQGTTATLAAKLGVKSGTDLIVAACARMTLVSGKASFNRKEITKEMQAATGYYKRSYLNNLSTYLQQLVKDRKLVEPTDGTFALSIPTRKLIEQQLAQT